MSFLCYVVFPGAGSGSPSSASVSEAARRFVNQLAQGRFTEAHSRFNTVMAHALPLEGLEGLWRGIEGQAGEFQGIRSIEVSLQKDFNVALVHCRFTVAPLVIKVTFEKKGPGGSGAGRMTGLFLLPDDGTNGERSVKWKAPSYADPRRFTETELFVGSGEWKLPATLTVPHGDGPFPGIVLVHGSGPQDRDETIGPNKPFKDLAWGLASRGIAVLRYDKRTKVYAAGMARHAASITTKEEVTDDVVRAFGTLKARPEVNESSVFVLGHSLGGTLIPRIAALLPRARGFVIMAGATRPMEDLVLEQTEYLLGLDGELSAYDRKQISDLRAKVARVKSSELSLETPASELPLSLSPAYWLDLRGYEPAVLLKGCTRPVLIINGDRDYQVTTADFDGWKRGLAGKKSVSFMLYKGLNHLFIPGVGKSGPSEYARPGHVDEKVIDDMARWILEVTARE